MSDEFYNGFEVGKWEPPVDSDEFCYDVIGEYNRAMAEAETNITVGGLDMSKRTFTYPKSKLLEEIKKNRENHREAFELALEAYKKEVIRVLEEQLEQARAGERIPRGHSLVQPMDMTREYDHIILMLEMTTEQEIELTDGEFAQYVMDRWHWKQQFAGTASAYLGNFASEGDLPATDPKDKRFGRALDVD
jgi:hypothetical protein